MLAKITRNHAEGHKIQSFVSNAQKQRQETDYISRDLMKKSIFIKKFVKMKFFFVGATIGRPFCF